MIYQLQFHKYYEETNAVTEGLEPSSIPAAQINIIHFSLFYDTVNSCILH